MIAIGSTIKKLRVINNVSQKEMSDFFHITIDTLFQGKVEDSNEVITDTNKVYLEENRTGWNQSISNEWKGTILPAYGPYTPDEEELKLFGNMTDKVVLELACGDGRSLLYHAKHGAKELYGLDISEIQIANAKKNFADKHKKATLFVSPMEVNHGIPFHYFDCVYSIYGIGWSLDIDKVFYLVSRYLKANGTFIFSWDNPLLPCLENQDGQYVLSQSYEEEKMICINKFGMQMNLQNWKISSYINALIKNGMEIEKMIETSTHYDHNANYSEKYYSAHKAKFINHSFIIKARKRH